MKKKIGFILVLMLLISYIPQVALATSHGLLKGTLETNKGTIGEDEVFEISVAVSNRVPGKEIHDVMIENIAPKGLSIVSADAKIGNQEVETVVNDGRVTTSPMTIDREEIVLTILVKGKEGSYLNFSNITSATMEMKLELEIEIKKDTTLPDKEKPVKPESNKDTELLNKRSHYAYLIGYPDGTIRPEGNITRGEVSTIFFRMMTDSSRNNYWSKTNSYSDVSESDWYNNAISTLSKAEGVTGYPDGSFKPEANITRGEFATMASRFLVDRGNLTNHQFTDIKGNWAEDAINKLVSNGLIKGYEDGSFKPNQEITRAEAATLMNAVLERTPHKDYLLKDMKRWSDNSNTNAWYYAHIQEASNSHEYERGNKNDRENWIKLLPIRDWSAFEKLWSEANIASNPGNIGK